MTKENAALPKLVQLLCLLKHEWIYNLPEHYKTDWGEHVTYFHGRTCKRCGVIQRRQGDKHSSLGNWLEVADDFR